MLHRHATNVDDDSGSLYSSGDLATIGLFWRHALNATNRRRTVVAMHAQTPAVARIAVSPGEAADMLGVTRATIYQLVARGQLRRYHAGRRALIPVVDIRALIGDTLGDSAS